MTVIDGVFCPRMCAVHRPEPRFGRHAFEWGEIMAVIKYSER